MRSPTSTTLYATMGGFLVGSLVTMIVMQRARRGERKRQQTDQAVTTRSSRNQLSLMKNSNSFVTDLIAQLWEYLAAAGNDLIRESLEPSFAALPGPLKTLRFTKLDLGDVPIQINNIAVREIDKKHSSAVGIGAEAVQCDFDVCWDGECEMRLKADFMGSFGVKSVKIKGRMSLLFKPFTTVLPIVKAVQYTFINPPKLQLDFTGLANLADFSMVDKAIRKCIQDSLAEVIVLPNRMIMNMMDEEQEDSFSPDKYSFLQAYEPPIGIARITVLRGRDFKVERRTLRKHDVPDVYCCVQLGSSPVWRTSTIPNSLEPVWNNNECADFLLSDHGQEIRIQAWDEDRGSIDTDDELGRAAVTVEEVLLAGRTLEVELEQNDKGTGAFVTVQCDIFPLVPDLGSLELEQEGHLLCGVLIIIITRAFDIPLSKQEAATFVKGTFVTHENRAREFLTGTVVDYPGIDPLNPVYDCAFHVPLTTKMMKDGGNSVILKLMNGETVLGTTALTLTHASLVHSPDKAVTERRKIGKQGASLEFRVCLRGMQIGGASAPEETDLPLVTRAVIDKESAASEVEESIGTVRITVVKGRGLQVKKRRFKKDDIPDVYCCIKHDSSQDVWRTSTIKNSVSPEWNESKNFSLSDYNQTVSVEAFDADKGTLDADDIIGTVHITFGKLLLAGGTTDVELQREGQGTGVFITLRCDTVDS